MALLRQASGLALKPPWFAIFGISATAIAYEILLLRLFSITQWYHFAYLVVSLALLGHGISGVVVSIFQLTMLKYYRFFFYLAILGFAFSSIVAFYWAQKLELNTLAVIWDYLQWGRLAAIYALLIIPFTFAAIAISLSLCRFQADVGKLYAADLCGAGLGVIGVALSLYYAFPQNLLIYLSLAVLGVLQVSLYQWRARGKPLRLLAASLAIWGLAVLLGAFLPELSRLQIATYKPLSKALLLPDSSVEVQRSSPFGWLSVVDSDAVPLRISPGLSLNNQTPLPDQKGLFIDAEGPFAINRLSANKKALSFLDYTTDSSGYLLASLSKQIERVLLVGLKGNTDFLQAHYYNAERVDVVEPNRQLSELLLEAYAEFVQWQYVEFDVEFHYETVRAYLRQTQTKYDLIKLPLVSRHGHTITPHYELSQEAMERYWRHLNPQGLIVITSGLQLPPRASLRLLNTLLRVLKKELVDPEQHIAVIRSWNRVTVLVKRNAFSAADTDLIKEFCHSRGFDAVYFPGINSLDANQFNQLPSPDFYLSVKALLSPENESFTDHYVFDIRAATDNQPFFHRFLRWSQLPELLASKDTGGLALLGKGYVVLIAALVLAVAFSILLILVPLFFLKRHTVSTSTMCKIIGYFICLGLAFLMVEMVFIQWFVLFLSHPIVSVMVVTASFLIFAGLGSACCRPLLIRLSISIRTILIILAGLGLSYILWLPLIFDWFASATLAIRSVVSIVLIAPLALLMGMPMPAGLSRLVEMQAQYKGPGLIAWAWGINGCASVISTVLTTFLAIHFGFALVLIAAFAIYATASLFRI